MGWQTLHAWGNKLKRFIGVDPVGEHFASGIAVELKVAQKQAEVFGSHKFRTAEYQLELRPPRG